MFDHGFGTTHISIIIFTHLPVTILSRHFVVWIEAWRTLLWVHNSIIHNVDNRLFYKTEPKKLATKYSFIFHE